MATKILFTFTAEDIGVAKAQDHIKEKQLAINKAIKEAKALGSPYDELLGESIKLKREAEALRVEQNKLNREFKATAVPKDSLAGLRLEYSKLTEQIKVLSAAERQSNFGQNLIKNAARVKGEIDGIEQSIGRFTGNVGNYKTAISGLARVLPALGVGLGVGKVIESTREFERLFAVLKQATGSEGAANKVFSDIQQFAKETPFQINELVGAFVKLENRNFNPTIEQLRTIGDIAASQGKTVDQFTEAILDAQTGEFERLKEFGIVARKNGDDVRVSFRGQSETFKNTSENISAYLLKIGELPGIQGSAIAVSKTLDGSLSNLVDNFTQLSASIGSGGGVLKGFVDGINSIVGSINELLETPLSVELSNQQREFNALLGVLNDTTVAESERNRVIETLKKEYPQYLKFVGDDTKGQINLAKTLEFGNSLFEQRILLQATEEERTKLTKEKIRLENELTEALKDQQKASSVGTRRAGGARNEASDLGQVENVAANAERRVLEIRNGISGITSEINELIKTSEDTALRTTGKSIADIEKSINGLFGDAENAPSSTGGNEGKIKALAGSIGFLSAEVDKLEKKINATPVSSGLLPELISDLDIAKQKLSDAQQAFLKLSFFLKFGRELSAPTSTTDNEAAPTLGFFPELQTPENEQSAKAQAAAIKAKVEEDLKAIEFPVEIKVDPESKAALDEFASQQQRDADEREQKRTDNLDKEKEKRQQIEDALVDAAVSSAQTAADTVFNIKRNQLEQEQSAKFAALDAEEAAAIEAANGNAVKEKAIRADFEKKRQELERQGAKKRKELALKEAYINTALAVTKALTGAPPPFGFILAGAALAAGVAQIADINSQEFWQGGKVKKLGPGKVSERPNAPKTKHGDNVLAYLKPGEMVLNEQQQSAIAQRAGGSIFSDVGVPGASRGSFVPYFASGGIVDVVPQTSFASGSSGVSLNAQASFSDNQVQAIGKNIGNLVAQEVSKQVKTAMAEGLGDANRRLERDEQLTVNRQG